RFTSRPLFCSPAPPTPALRPRSLHDALPILIKEAGVTAIANPLINITLQGRHDSYPKRRGMTRVPEMLDHGIPVAFGHDCVMDPDRKSTRLNSSHVKISYAVFGLKNINGDGV